MVRNRSRFFKRLDILGLRVNKRYKLSHILKVSKRLNSTGRGASTDRDDKSREATYFFNAFSVMSGRNRAFDQSHIVGTGLDGTRGFGKIGNLNFSGNRQKLILAVQE